jgi:hypothetical protein
VTLCLGEIKAIVLNELVDTLLNGLNGFCRNIISLCGLVLVTIFAELIIHFTLGYVLVGHFITLAETIPPVMNSVHLDNGETLVGFYLTSTSCNSV